MWVKSSSVELFLVYALIRAAPMEPSVPPRRVLCTRPLANQIPDTPCSRFQYPMIANVVSRSSGHIRCISFHRFRSSKNPSWLA